MGAGTVTARGSPLGSGLVIATDIDLAPAMRHEERSQRNPVGSGGASGLNPPAGKYAALSANLG